MKRWLIVGVVLVSTVLFGAESCDKANEPFKDAKRGSTNDSPADVGEMPDGFSNYATKCDHGNRVYVIFKSDSAYGSLAVVPNDPTCSGEAE
jgi:hypothetical protein